MLAECQLIGAHDGLAWVGRNYHKWPGIDLGALCFETKVPPSIEVLTTLFKMAVGGGVKTS